MKDKRNLLVTIIAEVARELRPRIVVVENVQAFLTRQVRHPRTGHPISAAKLLIDELAPSYEVFPILAELAHFGVPQSRKRTFLTFICREEPAIALLARRGKVPYPVPSHDPSSGKEPITINAALAAMKLPSLDAAAPDTAAATNYGGLHAVPVWLDRRYAMVAAIPKNSGRSAWQNNTCEKCGVVQVDDDDALCPQCLGPLLRPVVAQRRKGYRLISGFRTSTYRRMRSDSPAATITTASGHIGSNHTIHPYENRLLSTLECALIQTLPRGFNWGEALEKWGHTNIREMIGEAVPPLFTKKHGRVLREILGGRSGVHLLSADNRMHKRAMKKLGLTAPKSSRLS